VAHPSRPIVYAVTEVESTGGKPGGGVAAFRMSGGALTAAGTWASQGGSPCHAAVDSRGEYLVVANYGSGTVGVWRLVDGLPSGKAQQIRLTGHGPDRERQAGPHAHSAVFEPGGDRFRVQDLGTDRLWGFVLDRKGHRAVALQADTAAVAPGSGPRHLAFHPSGAWAYVINELNSTVVALARDAATGALTPFQTAGTLPAGAPATPSNWCADLHVSPDGRFLYGSNRGHDSLAVWSIAPGDGRLTPVQHVASGGGHPRNFALSPDGAWLLCANRDSDCIAVFRRDVGTGLLHQTGVVAAPHPVCLAFVP
jgi:6-phosphogluconolactonase